MGVKTALLVYAAEDPVESLRRAREYDPAATRALVAATHPAGDGYPLPFHPLPLGGETALRALFGFILGGRPQPADIDPYSVKLAGFQVPPAHPITEEMLAEFMRTHRRKSYRMGPDGTLIPVEAQEDGRR